VTGADAIPLTPQQLADVIHREARDAEQAPFYRAAGMAIEMSAKGWPPLMIAQAIKRDRSMQHRRADHLQSVQPAG
jgi:hypothetical protein